MSLYDSLPLKRDEIRVLTILPESHGIPCCDLKVVSMNSAHFKLDYALSHVWGPPAVYSEIEAMTSSRRVPLICNGCEILVTENVASFFQLATRNFSTSFQRFWIDVISINQDDIDERSRQVKIMGKIYSSAMTVIVWLGDEDKHTSAALALLGSLDATLRNSEQVSSGNEIHFQDYDLKEFIDHESWYSVARFFQRTFFARAWVIQEVILARRLLVFCGAQTISWDALVKTSRFLSETAWGVYLDRLILSNQLGPKSRWHVPAFLDSIRKSCSELSWVNVLLYSLVRSRDFQASDPRDKIYCLLGLIQEHIEDKPLLSPVYGDQSIATTYTRSAAQILESGDDLYLLSCVEGELFQRPEVGKIPSWVPDWTCGKSTGLLLTGYRRYAATKELTQRPQINYTTWTLTLQGKEVDTVSMVGEAKHEVISTGRFTRWLEIVTSLPVQYQNQAAEAGGQNRLEAFWRTLIRNTSGSPPGIVPKSSPLAIEFQAWLLEQTAGWGDAEAQDLLSSSKRHTLKDLSVATETFATTFTWAKHLRLFRTAGGLLGQGSECMKESDQVWIVPGSRVPLIFRPVGQRPGSNTYRLVGGAYVHGLMNGEAIESDQGQLQLTTLLVE